MRLPKWFLLLLIPGIPFPTARGAPGGEQLPLPAGELPARDALPARVMAYQTVKSYSERVSSAIVPYPEAYKLPEDLNARLRISTAEREFRDEILKENPRKTRAALARWDALVGDGAGRPLPERVALSRTRGDAHAALGELDRAATAYRQCAKLLGELEGEGHWRTIETRILADWVRQKADLPAGKGDKVQAARAALEQTNRSDIDRLAGRLDGLMAAHRDVYGDKNKGYVDALALRTAWLRILVTEQPRRSTPRQKADLASRAAAAHEEYRKSAAALYGKDHPEHGDALFSAGQLAWVSADFVGAETLFREAAGFPREPSEDSSGREYHRFTLSSLQRADPTWRTVGVHWPIDTHTPRELRLTLYLANLATRHHDKDEFREAEALSDVLADLQKRMKGVESWEYRQAVRLARRARQWARFTPAERGRAGELHKLEARAVALAGEKRFADARRALDELHGGLRALYGDDPVDEARIRELEASWLEREGKPEAALGPRSRALGLAEKAYGPRHPWVNRLWQALDQSQVNLARRAAEASRPEEAVTRWQALVALRQRFLGPFHWYVIDARRRVEDLQSEGRLKEEQRQELAEAARLEATFQAAVGPGVLSPLVSVAQQHDRLQQAQRVLSVRSKWLPAGHEAVLRATLHVADLANTLGDFRRARDLYRELLRTQTRHLGLLHPASAETVKRLIDLHTEVGEEDQARALPSRTAILERLGWSVTIQELRRVIAILLDPKDGATTEVVRGFRRFRRAMDRDDYVAAVGFAEETVSKAQAAYGAGHEQYAVALANLAGAQVGLGDYVRAKELYHKAVALLRARPEGDAYLAPTLHNLAVALTREGKHAEANRLLEEQLQVLTRRRELGSTDAAHGEVTRGMIRYSLGQSEPALESLRSAAKLFEKLRQTDHPAYLEALNNAGRVAVGLGRFDEAERTLKESQTIRQRLGLEGTDGHADLLHNLGVLADARGEVNKAADFYRQALRITWANVQRAALVQSQRQQMAMVQAFRERLDSFLSLAQRGRLPAAEVYQEVFPWKGATLLRRREVLSQGKRPMIQQSLARLQATSRQIAALSYELLSRSQEEQLARLTAERERQEKELIGLLREDGAFEVRPAVTLERLRKELGGDVVLIDLFDYRHVTWGPKGGGERSAQDRCAAFVVRREGVTHVDLGPAEPIRAAVRDWRKVYGHPDFHDGDEHPGAALRRLVWEPVARHIGEKQTVVFAPDGQLALFPFAALPGKKPDTYLIQERAVLVTLIPRLLVPDLPAGKLPAPREPSLLAIGHVNYGERAPEPVPETGDGPLPTDQLVALRGWRPLAGTLEEMYAVHTRFDAAFPAGRALLLHSLRASKPEFRQRAPEFRWLHLATHGFAVQAKKGAEGSGPARPVDLSVYHPGVLAGVALSGANHPGKQTEDGLMTALEVADLDLQGTEMVVLSACQTALGEYRQGEGTISLQRAFQVAGARNVVATLWPVEDEATQHLMRSFYQNLWGGKMGKAEALRQAQCRMLEKRSLEDIGFSARAIRGMKREEMHPGRSARVPPYFWAAFVLSGDGR